MSGANRAEDKQLETPKYTGPGSCSSASCHGGIQIKSGDGIHQNEYSTWLVKDRHARAYAVLSSPEAKGIGRILGIANVAEEARCLACHTLNVKPELRARTFELNEGVGCESCHGPASNWLGPHTTRGWTHEKSVAAGMVDTRDVATRTEVCLGCHLGSPGKTVDHELIAAGHPDLYFELESFSAAMPRHWREPKGDAAKVLRTWAVGQTVQLRDQMRRLSAEARGGGWPEFSQMDCFACHHALADSKNSWRQQRGYGSRNAGRPRLNLSRYAVLRVYLGETDRASARQLDAQIERVSRLVNQPSADRAALATAAQDAASLVGGWVERLSKATPDSAAAMNTARRVCENAEAISNAGERAAEQAAMAVNTLLLSSGRDLAPGSAQREAIDSLFKQFEDPSAYSAPKFEEQLRKLGALLK